MSEALFCLTMCTRYIRKVSERSSGGNTEDVGSNRAGSKRYRNHHIISADCVEAEPVAFMRKERGWASAKQQLSVRVI